jgi:hypothetical protein
VASVPQVWRVTAEWALDLMARLTLQHRRARKMELSWRCSCRSEELQSQLESPPSFFQPG